MKAIFERYNEENLNIRLEADTIEDKIRAYEFVKQCEIKNVVNQDLYIRVEKKFLLWTYYTFVKKVPKNYGWTLIRINAVHTNGDTCSELTIEQRKM